MPQTKNRKRLVILDTHAILHRAYHALPDFSTSKGEPTGALYGLVTMVFSIVETLKPDYIVAAFDLPKPTHRHKVYKEYKAGRVKTDENLVSQIIQSRDVLSALSIPIYDKEGFEADDVLGTIVHELKDNKDVEIIISSGDMDTLQLVSGKKVQVFTLKKGIKDTILYDEEAVVERFGFGPKLLPDYKGLRGDPSDNIIGIKGIGEKTATTLIKEFGTVESMYTELKKKDFDVQIPGITPRILGLIKEGEEEALFSKILATIRSDAPIQFSIPEKEWKESVDVEKAKDLFARLEFRTMGTRLMSIISGEKIIEGKVSDDMPKEEVIDERRLKEAAIMLWLINSSITDPTLDDVYTFTHEKRFDAAYVFLEKGIKEKGLESVYEEIEKPLIPILDRMKKIGVKIDTKVLKTLEDEYGKELEALEKSIWRMAGEEFNIASPKQLAEVLHVKMGLVGKYQKKTKGGALSTKESELEKILDLHPIVKDIMRYREVSKLMGTYIQAIPKLLDTENRVHPTFIQTGAATGRMASKDPGVQNIPNRTEEGRRIRKAFVSEKGWKLVTLDYSQMELRIAAFLSNDEKMIGIFTRNEDIHAAVASEVYGVPQDAVTKTMRSHAKTINFGVMYGMGVTALQKNLGTDRKTAQKFLNDYFDRFSGLASYLDRVRLDAARMGYTETLYGRRRYFEGITSKIPFVRAAAERMAINAPIQGTEADIVKLAMIHIDEYLSKNGLEDRVRPLLQVHDELVYEVREKDAEDFALQAKKIMESVVGRDKTKGIILEANASIADDWG